MNKNPQAPSTVVMVRPHRFRTNPETASDNAFQKKTHITSDGEMEQNAFDEVTEAVDALKSVGVEVLLFEDEGGTTPDSVFPNNWISTHERGQIVLYPMCHPTRRRERRTDIIGELTKKFPSTEVLDYSGNEDEGIFLEGTGAIVLDHIGRVAYATKSQRAHPDAFRKWCKDLDYGGVLFEACDENGVQIYHTNVLMCIATRFALIGLELIPSASEREIVEQMLSSNDRKIISLSREQIANFAGNAIELQGKDRRILALSQTAFNSLRSDQIAIIEHSADILPLSVPTIEHSGGSVRCMIAGVHLADDASRLAGRGEEYSAMRRANCETR